MNTYLITDIHGDELKVNADTAQQALNEAEILHGMTVVSTERLFSI